ncbi:hypothetical protein H1S01_02115 [Heliobacterium chlorum]|uniref:Uncharacterized protein n=1 Tax=Heliobacterium chlorum TaxID=2698 RepID=A0ABR7SXP1_HELCL|nr:hypothetical protein [Heliobacterium chlorum]MBC9783304.1 hypothetical protein [Heliobacterium chlorum]
MGIVTEEYMYTVVEMSRISKQWHPSIDDKPIFAGEPVWIGFFAVHRRKEAGLREFNGQSSTDE